MKKELYNSIDYLVWQNKNEFFAITKKVIKDFLLLFDDPGNNEAIEEGLISGRFEKGNTFDISDTIILGEDGGMYMLINSIGTDEYKII